MTLLPHSTVVKVVVRGLLAAALSLSLAACETPATQGNPAVLDPFDKPIVLGGEVVSDSPIITQVQKALKNNAETSLLRIQVTSVGDVIILKGNIDNARLGYAAEQVAGRVDGVRHVTNNLFVHKNR